MADDRAFDNLTATTAKLRTDLDDLRTTIAGRYPTYDRAVGQPLRLTGATQATRFVGGTASGPPTSGGFQVGDLAVAQDGVLFTCVAGGSPGTWVPGPGTLLNRWFRGADITTTATSESGATVVLTSDSIPVRSNRRYLVTVPSLNAYVTASAGDGLVGLRLRYTTDGSAPNGSSTSLQYGSVYCVSTGVWCPGTIGHVYSPPSDGEFRVSLLFWRDVVNSTSSATIVASSTYGPELLVIDLGKTVYV